MVLQQPDDQTILHTIGDDVAFGLENMGVESHLMPERIAEALSLVGLDLPLDHPTTHLSGGQRQRLALAGALAMRPQLLVLDEPLQALDSDGKRQVLDAIRSIRETEPITLVVIDHDPAQWRDLVEHVVMIDEESTEAFPADSAPLTWTDELSPRAPNHRTESVERLQCVDLVVGREIPLPGSHTLSVASGEILAITGPNGSGKSTLAMTLAGLIAPHGGQITTPAHPHQLKSGVLARSVSFVPQNPAHHHIGDTVAEDVARGLDLYEGPDADQRVELWLERFGLRAVAHQHPATLSGGEARRLALASATIGGQKLLVLDEPSQSLDRRARHTLVDLLGELATEGVGIVVVTHDRALIAALGAREYALSDSPQRAESSVSAAGPSWLTRANPLAVLGAATAVAVGLVARVDVAESLIALLAIIALLGAGGAFTKKGLVRLIPVMIAAVFAALTIALYGEQSGELLWSWGLMAVSEGSLALSLATLLRIAAIATPAVVLFQSVDATRLADALSQRLRLPERFVMGALAALRLVQVLGDDYRQLLMTRRSRGVGDQSRVRRIPRDVFAILVIALRRSRVLATAMEARGFGGGPRTHFRRSTWSSADWLILGTGCVVVLIARAGSAVVAGVL
jgi:energy-coupling factor transport system ATP-binding protein